VDGVAWLFCPADRPERFAKAAAVADVVILDLEDGTAPDRLGMAREAVANARLDRAQTVIRVHARPDPEHTEDLDAVVAGGFRTVMLAKTETRAEAESLARFEVIALCETPLGVVNAPTIAAAPNVSALMWGAEDLTAALGGSASRDRNGGYLDLARHARAAVLLAAGAARTSALDAVFLDIGDASGLEAEVSEAAAMGFGAKACIHPTQTTIVRAGFRPSDRAIAEARAIVAAASGHTGAFRHGNRMVDAPLVAQAQLTLARSRTSSAPH
jgi:citrate lyase subunit beta / citryl-CoA lyase